MTLARGKFTDVVGAPSMMLMMKWRGGASKAGEDQNYCGNDVLHILLLITLARGVVKR